MARKTKNTFTPKSVKDRKADIKTKLDTAPGRKENLAKAERSRTSNIAPGKPTDPFSASRSSAENQFKDARERARANYKGGFAAIEAEVFQPSTKPQVEISGSPEKSAEPQSQPTEQQPAPVVPTIPTPGETEDQSALRLESDQLQQQDQNDLPYWKTGSTQETPTYVKVVGATAVGLSIGATAIGTATVLAGINLLRQGALTSATVAEAASGKIKDVVAGSFKMNSVNAVKTMSWFAKLSKTAKSPTFLLGALGTYMFSTQLAFNDRGDTAISLSIAAREAAEIGDTEELARIKELSDDLSDPNMIQTLTNFAPVINYPLSAIKKMQAAGLLTDLYIEKQSSDFKVSPQVQKQREESSIYWDTIDAERKKAKEEERAADEAYWNNILNKKPRIG